MSDNDKLSNKMANFGIAPEPKEPKGNQAYNNKPAQNMNVKSPTDIKQNALGFIANKAMHSDVARNVGHSVANKAEKLGFISKLRIVLTNWPTIVAIAYLLLPIDIIPDALPVVGQIDDLMPLLWAMVNAADKVNKSR